MAEILARHESYVGVSGVVSPDQERWLAKYGHDIGLDLTRRLHLGIKATHDAQYLDQPDQSGDMWHPVGAEAFRHSVIPERDQPNVTHIAQMYMDPAEINRDELYPKRFVRKIQERGQGILDGIQFDRLPYADDIKKWGRVINHAKKSEFGELAVIVQCDPKAMAQGTEKAIEALMRLSMAAGEDSAIDYVLFDASSGTGKEMNSDALLPFLDAAYSNKYFEAMGTNFGVAGGLNADMVRRHMGKILARFPDVSWDAESRLHRGTDDKSLNVVTTESYLAESVVAIAHSEGL